VVLHPRIKYPVAILLAIAVICPLATMGVLVRQRYVERTETVAQTEQLRDDVALAIDLEVLGLWATTAQITEPILAELQLLGITGEVIDAAFAEVQSTSGRTISDSLLEPRVQLTRAFTRLEANEGNGRLFALDEHQLELARVRAEFQIAKIRIERGDLSSDETNELFAGFVSALDDATASQINQVFEGAAGQGALARDIAALQSILRAHRAVVVELEAASSATGMLLPGFTSNAGAAGRAVAANAVINHEEAVFRRVATEAGRRQWNEFLATTEQQRYAELRAAVPSILEFETPADAAGTVKPEFIVLGFNRMSLLVDEFVPAYLERMTSELDGELNETAATATRTSYLAIASALVTVLLTAASTQMLLRPLGKLRQRAHDLTLGIGGHAPLGPIGPREVATVAVAMDDLSSTLNVVEGQLQAISERDFSAAVLQTRLPGAVGRSLEKSMQSASESSAVSHRQARADGLTGLPNRPEVLERLENLLDEADPEDRRIAAVFMDLDRFKGVNDSLGHKAGDELLIQFAERVTAVLLPDEFIGRIGGDEFLAVSQNIAGAAEAVAMTERMLASVSEPFEIVGQPLELEASAGIAIADADHGSAAQLLQEADLALYASKQASRRITVCTPDLLEVADRERATMTAVESALVTDEFRLHLQPIVDLVSGEIVAAEALLRWVRDGEFVSPADYIPIIEPTALISKVGRWVLHDAALQVAAVRDRTGTDLPVSVNISWNHLAYGSLVEDVQSALRSAAIPSRLLQLEFTESTPPPDMATAIRVLNELKAMGVGLWLDDFGSGYTSITQLTEMSFATVKLDRSFVSSESMAGNGRLVESLIGIIKTLGIEVIVEGVEVEAERLRMLASGAELGQGWLWSRDLPVDELIASLEAQSAAGSDAELVSASTPGATSR